MEELIAYLARYGRLHLWQMSDGDWACRLEMFVTGKGVSFEVKFVTGKTPLEALEGCKMNLVSVLEQLAEIAKAPPLPGPRS